MNVILKLLKNKSYHPRIFYPTKLPLMYKGEIKASPDKQKLRVFITTRSASQEMLKGALVLEVKTQKYRSF